MDYWVYENNPKKYAKVHRGDCPYCKHGQGTHGATSTWNGQWHGPLDNVDLALATAKNTGKRTIRLCVYCGPQGSVKSMDKLQWKAKIGLIVVSSSTVAETRYPRVAPPDVGFFTSRMLLRPGGEIEALVEMEANADRAVEELASAHVDSIAYCCTVSGALRGPEKDAEFCREMEEQWGVSTTSTMLACTEALESHGDEENCRHIALPR